MEREYKNGIQLSYYNRLLEWKDKNGYTFIKYAEFIQSIDYHGRKPCSLSELSRKELVTLYNFAFNSNLNL